MAWRPNETGTCPRSAKGKRVFVKLRNGREPKDSWAADGQHGCNWALDGHDFSIAEWRLA